MKITRIREATAPIASEIRNAFISFSTMTISVVAVETDVVREGKPVVGYGFSSNGRYSQGGILRERFIPRIMAAEPRSLIDGANDNLDALFGPEDAEPCVECGAIPGADHAGWCLVGKEEADSDQDGF